MKIDQYTYAEETNIQTSGHGNRPTHALVSILQGATRLVDTRFFPWALMLRSKDNACTNEANAALAGLKRRNEIRVTDTSKTPNTHNFKQKGRTKTNWKLWC